VTAAAAPATATSPAPPPTGQLSAGPSPTRAAWRGALPVWLGSRLAVLLLGLGAAREATGARADAVGGPLVGWYHWDVALFIEVARYGWFSPAYTDRTAVDFPGMPLALRLMHLVARDWVLSGLLVSLVAGAVASATLWQLAADEAQPQDREAAGRLAVLLLVLSPYAVFLFAGYSEGLFLAFVCTSWLAARRGRWALAVGLACGATATRVTGIPFAAALAVEYLVQRRGRPDRRAVLLVLPALPVALFIAHLHALSGSWTAYTDAQREGWGRTLAAPWSGWSSTWHAALNGSQSAAYQMFWIGELSAAVLGVVLTVVLVRQHRWGEAVYVGGNTLLMTSSSYYASGVRSALVWFPLWLLLARTAVRRPWLSGLLLWASAPLMAAAVVGFTTGAWID